MSKLAQISRAKHAFNSDLLGIIINALVFSKLYYCSSVWSNTSASNMQKLQLVQNFAARIISGATKFEHITPSLDLPEAVSECSILMYADDTVLFYSSSQVSTIEMKLNEELLKIERWLFSNSLFINVKKTGAMLFGTAPRLTREKSFNICIDGKQIERVHEFTCLSVVFDERLSWGTHVRKVISKAGKRVGMLGRLRDNLTTQCANVVYISLIRPILEYCDTLWGCCGEGNSQALEALQKRAGIIVANTSRSSPAMDILKWPALAERRREHVFQLVNKCIEGRCPQYFDGYFTFNSKIHSRATRQRDLLHLPAVRTEVAKRSFYYYGCVVFNDISLCLKN